MAAALLSASARDGEGLRPGRPAHLQRQRCVPVEKRDVLPLLGSFYYNGPQPAVVQAPQGAPMFELRFSNGYTTGIVPTRRLDRFLS